MSYAHQIAEALQTALQTTFSLERERADLEAWVEVPKDKTHGDVAFPCFRLAKSLRKPPAAIAAELLPELTTVLETVPDLAGVTATGPYLNFIIDKAALAARLLPGILAGDFLKPRSPAGERVMIEYSQPNTHKAFHVGHTRNAALGDALIRLFEWNGYEVVAANYIGDEGAHIAKCLWYFQNHFEGEVPPTNRGEFLGELYTQATLLLDFTLLTRCPLPGVVTARVDAINEVPERPKLKKVTVQHGSESVQVICGGSGYRKGDIVAYAGVGSRVAGRLIGAIEKAGVQSTGMICSEKELGLSEEGRRIYVFSGEVPLGLEVAEYFRIEGALAPEISVVGEMERRTRGVTETLRKLEAKEPETHALWRQTRQWSLDEFREIYRWLDVRFDHYFYESEVGDTGKEIVLDYYGKGVLIQSEGAIGADLSEAGLPFFLLLKSDGTGLYSTKDLALAREKFENFGIDRSIYVVDASQSLHFQQVFKTLEKMGYQRAKNCFHLAYGLVVLPDGKMSSRSGNIILFSDLRARLDAKIKEMFLEKYRGDWPDAEIEEAARHIAVATIKYGMLNQDNLKNIVFDLDEWTARTGNTGPYLLYAYARTRSILRKVGAVDAGLADWSLLTHETEQTLLANMARFPEVAARACAEYRPQIVCAYLYQLAKDFSQMFDHCSVIRAESPALKATRYQLVDAAGHVIDQGLSLLGIETLARM